MLKAMRQHFAVNTGEFNSITGARGNRNMGQIRHQKGGNGKWFGEMETIAGQEYTGNDGAQNGGVGSAWEKRGHCRFQMPLVGCIWGEGAAGRSALLAISPCLFARRSLPWVRGGGGSHEVTSLFPVGGGGKCQQGVNLMMRAPWPTGTGRHTTSDGWTCVNGHHWHNFRGR